MERFQPRLTVTVLLCGLAWLCTARVYAQSQSVSRGVEVGRAVVNMQKLAEEELKHPSPTLLTASETEDPWGPIPMPRPTGNIIHSDDNNPHDGVRRPDNDRDREEKGGPRLMNVAVASPPLASSFAALGDAAGYNGFSFIPPDTHGAVGPNHLMTTLNSQIRIQNKSGSIISTVSHESFWGSVLPGGLGSTPRTFDPKVIYDPFNNRWIFTAVANPNAANSAVLIAVSQTSDPTGSWNLFAVDADGGSPTLGTAWADFPSIGFNKNWIAVTVNMFTNSTNAYVNTHIYVFKKADLYNNVTPLSTNTLIQPTPSGRYFTVSPALTYDNSISDLYTLEEFNGNDAGNGELLLSKISGAIGSETFSDIGLVTATGQTWNDIPPGGADFAPQSGTSEKIQLNDARMTNVVYRNGKLWCAQPIFLPAGGSATRSSAQWWQISTVGGILQRGRIDDATGTLFYGYPSIAVNANDNALLGFSRFSGQQFASANYAYRASSDPVNTMRDELVMKAGEASYVKRFGGTRNRWGDYSATSVDPTNDVDLWTIQEYAGTPVSGTDKWGTWWGRIGFQPEDLTLPVELASFDLSSASGLVSVDWRTASEVNNAGFEVYRSNDIDPDFKIIASYLNHPELTGLGTTSQGKVYHYTDGDDGSLIAGQTYNYRLVDVGTDGARKEHEAKSIRIESGANAGQVYPFKIDPVISTPFSQQVMVPFQLPEAAPVTIEIYSILGQRIIVPVEGQMYTAGIHGEAISIALLPAGAYIMKVSTPGQSRSRTFVIVR